MSELKQQLIAAAKLSGNSPCGRYAPSPTGPQHMGNIRTALLAWLQARLAGGRFILRIDDLDLPRVKAGSTEQIIDDLHWLGLDWDEGPDIGGPNGPYFQSERIELYETAIDQLTVQGLVYPCYCSRKDIKEAASAPHEPGHVLKYPGTCRPKAKKDRTKQQTPDKLSPNIPAWRFRVEKQTIDLKDKVAGRLSQNLNNEIGDFVLRRRDNLFAYQLATVVDDIEMGVSDVLRGADLLDSAPRQIALFNALGAKAPHFWHVPLMLDDNKKRLSKRDGADSLLALRQTGTSAGDIITQLANDLGLCNKKLQNAIELLAILKTT